MELEQKNKLRFYNLTENKLRVLVTSTEIPLLCLNKSQEHSKELTDQNDSVSKTGSSVLATQDHSADVNSKSKYVFKDADLECSDAVESGEVIVKKGVSHDFSTNIEKYITVRDETASVPLLLNYKSRNCVFYYSDTASNVGFGDKIYYGDEICLYNWKFEKFLNRYTRKSEPCGRLGDHDEALTFAKSYPLKDSSKRVPVKNGDILYVIAKYDHKNLKDLNGMYISAGNVIYFCAADNDYVKQRWRICKDPTALNSNGVDLHEGDIVSIESDYDENNFVQTMLEKGREFELECSVLRNIKTLDEHSFVIMKKRN